MNKQYDYLIVGTGLFGSICAHEFSKSGYKCLVIDKRNHIGGNCYTEKIDDINVYKYGGHIFHTNDEYIWKYINKYSKFNNYQHHLKVNYNNKIYSFPINLFTLYQIYGIITPEEAKNKLDSFRNNNIFNISNSLEDWIINQVGRELYQIFIKGYTEKQWGKPCNELPSNIIKRIPIRLTYNDCYYNEKYQGIPIDGYTKIFNKMLNNIEVRLNTDYFDNRDYFDNISDKIIFTGNIDKFYNYQYGKLEYRSLYFHTQILPINDFQGVATMNYTSVDVPYTRIIEHKHFDNKNQNGTIITYEYSTEGDGNNDFYYPINDDKNNNIYNAYKDLTKLNNRVIIGGRIGGYTYCDMDKTIANALELVRKETGCLKNLMN
jgi:UDP-galactopyranose mutase